MLYAAHLSQMLKFFVGYTFHPTAVLWFYSSCHYEQVGEIYGQFREAKMCILSSELYGKMEQIVVIYRNVNANEEPLYAIYIEIKLVKQMFYSNIRGRLATLWCHFRFKRSPGSRQTRIAIK